MTTRMLTIPVVYDGAYVERPRGRRIEHRFRADLPVSIQDMGDGDAPLAIEIDCVPGAHDTVPFRWDGQDFWRPMLAEDGRTPMTVESLEERRLAPRDPLIRYVEGGVMLSKNPAGPPLKDWPFPRSVNMPGPEEQRYEDPFRLQMREDLEFRWVDDGLENAYAKAQSKAESLASINGILHLRIVEPHLEIDPLNGIRVRPFLPHAASIASGLSSSTYSVRLRLDRLEEALDLYDLHEGSGPTWPAIGTSAIRIHRPECLRFDEVEPAAKKLFGQIVDAVRDDLGKLRSETIGHWCRLRDAGEDHAKGDPEAFLRGMDAFAEMVGSGFDIDRKRHPYSSISDRTDGMAFLVSSHDRFIRPILESNLNALGGFAP